MRITRHATWFVLPALLAVSMFLSCQRGLEGGGQSAATHNFILKFKAMAGSDPLVFGNTYTNTWGEDYTVSAFKFYVSHIKLVNTVTGVSRDVNKDEYFLVNFADDNSTALQLKAVPGLYHRIVLLLGVDSTRNVSGAQTGALDPAKGMFWTWNTGYIMAKLEGNSPASAQVNNKFEYHIGGFSGVDNVLKQLTLDFPFANDVQLQAGKSSEMTIAADINTWFSDPHSIRLSVNPVCMSPGPLARQISENYLKMLTITGFVNQ